MATYTYDDGSTISNEQTPMGWSTTSTPATDNGVAGWFAQDRSEQSKYAQLYPENGRPFWESLALLGVSKGFDAHFQQQAIDAARATAGATYAGQNGQTYATGQYGPGIGGISPLMLLLIGGAILFVVVSD